MKITKEYHTYIEKPKKIKMDHKKMKPLKKIPVISEDEKRHGSFVTSRRGMP